MILQEREKFYNPRHMAKYLDVHHADTLNVASKFFGIDSGKIEVKLILEGSNGLYSEKPGDSGAEALKAVMAWIQKELLSIKSIRSFHPCFIRYTLPAIEGRTAIERVDLDRDYASFRVKVFMALHLYVNDSKERCAGLYEVKIPLEGRADAVIRPTINAWDAQNSSNPVTIEELTYKAGGVAADPASIPVGSVVSISLNGKCLGPFYIGQSGARVGDGYRYYIGVCGTDMDGETLNLGRWTWLPGGKIDRTWGDSLNDIQSESRFGLRVYPIVRGLGAPWGDYADLSVSSIYPSADAKANCQTVKDYLLGFNTERAEKLLGLGK